MAPNYKLTHIVFALLLLPSLRVLAQQCSATSPCALGCCSKYGGCGFGDDFCSPANCVGTCDAEPQCSATKACESGCCGKSGACGFGEGYCDGDCVNNCDAKSECGVNAPAGQEKCPLNVCCSQFGYCGTTELFCDDKCQNGCITPSDANCGGSSADSRTIGYYESWSTQRPCDAWYPEDLNTDLLTHINFAFAMVGSDNRIAAANPYDVDLYTRTTNLKNKNPSLKVFISVGGWDAGTAGFVQMASSAANRATFITSAKDFMTTYGFDGIDIDWEYPVADDRGGTSADMENYVYLLQEMRNAFGKLFGITATIPNSYWYLRGFDIVNMVTYVDWFNVMSYDIHGTWDGHSKYSQPLAQPHTNITEIADGLALLWRNNIPRNKVVLGLAFYGRSFTLKDPACNTPGCEFRSGGEPGACTGTSGVLSNSEIYSLIDSQRLSPVVDEDAMVKWVTWNSDQWVSFDDADTYTLKRAWANKQCLAGTMIWAISQDSKNYKSLDALSGSLTGVDKNSGLPIKDQLKLRVATKKQNTAGLLLYWSDCEHGPKCPPGFSPLSQFAKPVAGLFSDSCTGTTNRGSRALCVEDDVEAKNCHWYGGIAPKCTGTCPAGFISLANSYEAIYDYPNQIPPRQQPHCSYSRSEFCCESIEASNLQDCSLGDINGVLGGAGAGLSGDVGRLNRRLQMIGSIPIQDHGPVLEPQGWPPEECMWQKGSLQIGNPNPGSFLANLPGVFIANPNAGQAGALPFVFHSSGKSLVKPPNPGQPDPNDCVITDRQTTQTTTFPITTKTCDGAVIGSQACYHYASVAAYHGPAGLYETLTCPLTRLKNRTAPKKYDREHNKEWYSWIDALPGVNGDSKEHCQRDEFPFFSFSGTGNNYYQWIRFLSSVENGAGGILANSPVPNRGMCLEIAPSSVASSTSISVGSDGRATCLEHTTTITTRSRLYITYSNLPNLLNGAGLGDNMCTPNLVQDGGFAIFTDDSYFGRNGLAPPNWKTPPNANQIAGRTKPTPNGGFKPRKAATAVPAPPPPLILPPAPAPHPSAPPARAPLGPHPQLNKRAVEMLDNGGSADETIESEYRGDCEDYDDAVDAAEVLYARMLEMVKELDEDDALLAAAALGLVINEGNSTRRPTAEELRDEYGLFRCGSDNCAEELAMLGMDVHGRKTVPAVPAAEATAAVSDYRPGQGMRPAAVPVVPLSVATATGGAVASPEDLKEEVAVDEEEEELRRAIPTDAKRVGRRRPEMRRREMPTTTPAPSLNSRQ